MTPLDLGDWFADQALDGSLVLAVPVALVAGLVSFFSPCVVPLLPGYLSYATGLSGADLADARRGRMLAGSLLFVLGFSFVFVSFGALIGGVGEWLFTYERADHASCSACLTIVLGLVFLGVVPWMQRDWRVHQVPAVGLAAAPAARRALRPRLGAVHRPDAERGDCAWPLNEASAGRGALLSFVYCLGLGLPFIVAALAYRRMLGTVGWVRRHQQWVTAIGGADADRRRAAAGHRLVGRDGRLDPAPGSSPASRRASELPDEGRARPATPRPTPAAASARARALGVAPAHLDADGADPAVPARARVRSPGRWCRRRRSTRCGPRSGASAPQADAGLREARAVLGLQLGVVLGDLHPADGLAGGLLRAAACGSTGAAYGLGRRGRRGNLSRLPQHRTFETDEDPDAVLERARPGCGKRRYRWFRPGSAGDGGAVSARARLPARGRQPAVPPLGAGRAGGVRGRRAVRASRAG